MSVSDEEDFASAEEGEEEIKQKKPVKKDGKGEPVIPTLSAKGKHPARSSGNQKGKQQPTHKKKPTEASIKETKQVIGPGKATSKKVLAEEKSAPAPPQAAVAHSKEGNGSDNLSAASTAIPLEKELGTTSNKESSTGSAESKEQGQVKETIPDEVSGGDKVDSRVSSEAAGDRQSELKSELHQSKCDNPAVQVISRDSGDSSVVETAEEGKGQTDARSDGSWSWGWGSSFINAATSSLETFTSQVGEGLATIIDTVESSLGVPNPEDLAHGEEALEKTSEPSSTKGVEGTVQSAEKESVSQEKKEADHIQNEGDARMQTGSTVPGETEQEKSSWLSGWGMSSLTVMGKSLVTKSQSLMNSGFEKAEVLAAGGLDILESIGKKTYTTLTEHDPGLRRAREFLNIQGEKPSLLSVLREAHEQAEKQAKLDEEFKEALKINFGALFEDNQGFAHLEALEMLSNQSERKVQSLLSHMADDALEIVRPQLVEIKDVFEQVGEVQDKDGEGVPEHDFSKLVTENLSELHMGTTPDKLNQAQESVRHWIADFYSHEDHSEISDAKEVQQRAIQSLAEVTAKAVEQFHKAGERVLLQTDVEKTCIHRAKSLARLVRVLVTEVDILATKFSQCLNKIAEKNNTPDEVNPMVTNIYVEASNACGYIQDAFQLLLPVLQHAALQSAVSQTLS